MNSQIKKSQSQLKTITGVLIVRNEMRTIEKCLLSLKSAVDQIVVVDTGSTDETVSIMRNLGIEVHEHEWKDDFSDARNFALSLVKTDWVISIDGDEILYPEDVDSIRSHVQLYDGIPGPFALQILQMNKVGSMISPSKETRMFPMNRGLFWTRPIHEQLVTKDNNRIPVYPVNIRVFHDGYDNRVVNIKQKYERNIRILEKHVRQHPDDSVSYAFLGRENLMLGNTDEAIKHLDIARSIFEKDKSRYTLSYAEVTRNLALAYEAKGDNEQAERLLYELTQESPNYIDGWYLRGFSQMKKAAVALQSSKQSLQRAVELTTKGADATDATIGTFKAALHLADVNRLSSNWVEARKLYKQILRDNPNFTEVKNIMTNMDNQILKLAEEIKNESSK